MRKRLVAPLVLILSTVAGGQISLPPDIHSESLSRLPPVQRADLHLLLVGGLSGACGENRQQQAATPPHARAAGRTKELSHGVL